jgi:hypothetical protein
VGARPLSEFTVRCGRFGKQWGERSGNSRAPDLAMLTSADQRVARRGFDGMADRDGKKGHLARRFFTVAANFKVEIREICDAKNKCPVTRLLL